jgi:hypothetical protein
MIKAGAGMTLLVLKKPTPQMLPKFESGSETFVAIYRVP